jgi:hypothetical protein
MKHINLERLSGLPTLLRRVTGMVNSDAKQSRLSKTMTVVGGAIMLSLQLLSGRANAQVATYTGTGGTSTTVSYATNATGTALLQTGLGSATPCSSGGLSGLTNNGVTTFSTSNGHVYFTVTANPGYVLNITGFTCKLRRSGSGISKVRMAYYTTSSASTTNDLVDKAPDNASCGGGSTVFSWNTGTGGSLPTGVTSFTAELFPYAPISSGGVLQINQITLAGTVTPATPTCPTLVAGSVTPSSSAVCTGGTTALSLTSGTTGSNIAYQWQSSPDASTWTDITGATSLTYSAAPTTLTYYRVNTTCILSGGSTTTSGTGSITVNPTPSAGAIVGAGYVEAGTTVTLTNPTATSGAGFAGVWTSSSTSIATIDPLTGALTGANVGVSTISYTVTNTTTGCNATTTASESVIYPGDLAIYLGTGGTSTSVTGIPGETVGSLTATGFGTNSPCTTGGLSGLTVPVSVTTYNSASGPYVSYVITPGSGNALNVTRFWVSSRSSGTGPDSGRLAYRIGGGAWISEGFSHAMTTGGSCGARSNTWSWTPSAALIGITSSIEIAFFPYHPSASTGTIQVQQLEVIGTISSGTPCSGTPAAGSISPATTVACLSGYANMTFTGTTAPGISYQWQQNVNGAGFTDIAGANNVYYTSPVYTVVPTNIIYQVVTTCTSGSTTLTATSVTSSLDITPLPSPIDPLPAYLLVGSANAITLTDPTTGGKWYTQYPAIATIDSLTGYITGNIAGITAVIYRTPGFGCVVTDSLKVIQPNTLSVYLGKYGNSTTVTPVATPISAAELSAVTPVGAFGTATPCSRGGVSGLTVPTSYTSFGSGNPHVSYTMSVPASAASIDVTGIYTTVRSSNSGPASYSIAYRLNGGTWIDGGDFSTDIESCGESTVDQNVTFGSPISMAGTDVLEVAVYPYASVSGTGTFQVNTIDIVGAVKCPQVSITNPLNNGTYGTDCDGLTATATVTGGTWSSSNTAAATIDPATGVITFFNADDVTDIIYTTPCGNIVSVNINVTGDGSCPDGISGKHANTTTVTSVKNNVPNVTLYPNPATTTLTVVAGEKVNVAVMSIDGKLLIEQKEATTVNVSSLTTGVYMIKVYDMNGNTIKTTKFEKN